MTRRAATIAAVALAVIALGVVTAASYEEARALLQHRGTRARVTPADSGLAYETVPFAASDGTVLEGWWIVPKDGVRRRDLATVVLCHPEVDSLALATGTSGKARMLGWAAPLSRAGFIVLAFDFRSYGGSAGHLTTGGWRERGDLDAAIGFAHARCIGAPVAVVGESMGATLALLARGADSRLSAVVAVAPRASWEEAITDQALPAGGPWGGLARVLAPPAMTRGWIARELGGTFEGDRPGMPTGASMSTDSTVVVVPARLADDRAWLTGLALSTIERPLDAAVLRAANKARAARADSLDRANGRVDSLSYFGDQNRGMPY
jgi:pimeloyl-ACP methyl ester carboxylesterase